MRLPARISGGGMNESWEEARARCEAALGELVEGKSEAFKERWSRSDLTVIMGAFGGYERGWEHVAQRLDWASKGIRATGRRSETLLNVVGQDLACTVELVHIDRTINWRIEHRGLRSSP